MSDDLSDAPRVSRAGAPLHRRAVSPLLARAARQATCHRFLMAQPLATYRDRHRLDDAQLAHYLGCSVPALHGLALCRRPQPASPRYTDDLHALATYIGCDAARLRVVLEDTPETTPPALVVPPLRHESHLMPAPAPVTRTTVPPLRVLVAEGNTLLRESLAALLGHLEHVRVVGQAPDVSMVVQRALWLHPDVVLIDRALPGGGGLAATRTICAEHPEQVVCMLAETEDDAGLLAAIAAGARGYLLKSAGVEELHQALRVLAENGAILPPSLARQLFTAFARYSTRLDDVREADKLTPREREIVVLVAQGATNQEIARTLGTAENTVKVHLRSILGKLQLRNRQHTAAFAVQAGMVAAECIGDRQKGQQRGAAAGCGGVTRIPAPGHRQRGRGPSALWSD